MVLRNDTARFPYQCYYLYCAPAAAGLPATAQCDPYSNPAPQELQQLLPCDEWTVHGFPRHGEGWVGDDTLWQLDVGGLGARVYLTGDEPVAPALARNAAGVNGTASDWPGMRRSWISFEVGPEQSDGSGTAMARWEVTEWDVQDVPHEVTSPPA